MPLNLPQHENQTAPIANNLKRVFTSQASPLVLAKLKKIYRFNRPSDYRHTVLSDVIIAFTNTDQTFNDKPVLILNIYMPKRLPKYKAKQLRSLTSNPNNGVLAIPIDFLNTSQISRSYKIGFDKESLIALFTDQALTTELMTASLQQQRSESHMRRYISGNALPKELPLIMNQTSLRPLIIEPDSDQFFQNSFDIFLVEWLHMFQQIMLSQSLILERNK